MRSALIGLTAIAIACVGATGCGQAHPSNPFCATVKQHRKVFVTKNLLDKAALDEFLAIANAAPPQIRPDLLAVRDGMVHFYTSDQTWVTDKKKVDAWLASWKRVDDYLQSECAVTVPTTRKGLGT